MPGKVKVKIIAGRNLPVMDRASDTTDAYVEIKLGTTTYKTDVCRKSLNPQWNSDWYRFEIDDSELQDEPLQIRLMDHDTYSANDAIGKVYLDLNPLLLPAAGLLSKYGNNKDSNSNQNTNSVMSGWIPVYDTMHGIRGEVNITVKVELFSDFNKFRQSSCGVPFFCSSVIPHGYHARVIHGFVEELIVNDDPEYQWIDKIRTPRASNEARQTLFFKLSGELQRKIGVKALELGGNAVIGYSQCFDLEGESGIVARGIGTAVTLIKQETSSVITSCELNSNDRVTSYLKFISADNFRLNQRNDFYNKTLYLISQLTCPIKFATSPSMHSLCEESAMTRKNRKEFGSGRQLFTRHLSRDDFWPPTPHSRHDSYDSLQFLLMQEDLRGTKNGISEKIRNLKFSSQNIIYKKVGFLKARLSEKGLLQEDDADPKILVKTSKSVLKHKPHYVRSKSSSSGMAELLVRSVMHQHNSLDCISEHHDSEDTPERNIKENDCANSNKMVKTRSEPYLIAPSSSYLSNASSSSSESSFSSDEEITKEETKIELETVSLIVKNVEKEIKRKASLKEQILISDNILDAERKEKSFIKSEDSEVSSDDELSGYSSSSSSLISNDKSFSNTQLTDATEPVDEVEKLERSKYVLDSGLKTATEYKNSVDANQDGNNLDSTCTSDKTQKLPNKSKANAVSGKRKSTISLPEKKIPFVPQIIKKFRTFRKSSKNNVPISSSLTSDDINCSNKVPVQIGLGCVSVSNSCINKKHAASLNPSNRPFGSFIPDRVVSTREPGEVGHQRTESVGGKSSYSPARLYMTPSIHRRSSDSDLSITPKGNSLNDYSRVNTVPRTNIHQENFDIMEYPFLTILKYPPGFITHLGGAVSARSVKLLERISNIEEPESRDTWWSELRMEIRSHARALNCNAVLGYSESASICEDVCVLSATGAAAVIGLHYNEELSDNTSNVAIIPKNSNIMTSSLDKKDFQIEKDKQIISSPLHTSINAKIEENVEKPPSSVCEICHIPYNESNVPFRITLTKCNICKTAKVPDVLLTTVELPEGVPVIGRGCFLQSYVCRPKRDLRGELNAKEISDGLPFLEYELHRLLVNKLKVKGMNAVFGLNVRISVGERLMIGIATGTAVFLSPLPLPPVPILVSDGSADEKKLAEMQNILSETVKKNKEIYQLKLECDTSNSRTVADTDDQLENNHIPVSDVESKDSCVLEIDDAEDIESLNLLMESRPPDGFHVVNTEFIPGLDDLELIQNLQMFTQIWRAKIPLNQPSTHLDKHFHRLLQSVYFKLRSMIPCALCNLKFRVDLPEQDEIQLCVLGMALGLGNAVKASQKENNKKQDEELIFNLEEDQSSNDPQAHHVKQSQKSVQKFRITKSNLLNREKLGVDITPLSYIPGGKIEKYLGNLSFFFIRETTSIREGGGFSGFIHSFVTEVLAIVRAHITALGGNAMVAYFLTECVLYQNPHKNQGQCLINVGGDVVQVTYSSD